MAERIASLRARLETQPVRAAQPARLPRSTSAVADPQATLEELLDSEDIVEAIAAHQAELTPELLALVRASADAATAQGDADLADGLLALLDAIAETA